jgi:hypothetical protein
MCHSLSKSHQCSSTGLSEAKWCVDCLWFIHLMQVSIRILYPPSRVDRFSSRVDRIWCRIFAMLKCNFFVTLHSFGDKIQRHSDPTLNFMSHGGLETRKLMASWVLPFRLRDLLKINAKPRHLFRFYDRLEPVSGPKVVMKSAS